MCKFFGTPEEHDEIDKNKTKYFRLRLYDEVS